MSSSSPTVRFAESTEGDELRRVSTGGSSLTAIHEGPEHKQDWTITTDEKDSWANRERRRSSVWAKLELVPDTHKAATSPKQNTFVAAGQQPRRGSILSMWQGGKDKNGKDILAHDDHDASDEDESAGPPRNSEDNQMKEKERRGSILSIWKKGKDEHGNPTIIHDDEEWKV